MRWIVRRIVGGSEAARTPHETPEHYWSVDTDLLTRRMDSAAGGLSTEEAGRRLRDVGPNQVREHRRLTRLVCRGYGGDEEVVLSERCMRIWIQVSNARC
jgi:hypothetical protein